MQKKWIAALLLAMPLAHAADTAPKLGSDEQKAAYALGYRMGAGLQRDAADLDVEIVKKGMNDGLRIRAKRERLCEFDNVVSMKFWPTTIQLHERAHPSAIVHAACKILFKKHFVFLGGDAEQQIELVPCRVRGECPVKIKKDCLLHTATIARKSGAP